VSSATEEKRAVRHHAPRYLALVLLMLSFGLALTSAIQKSPTMDEQNHIARGAAYLGTGDPRLSVEHPPLVNVLSALPAHLLLDLSLPLDGWWEAGEWYHFADNFLWRANQDPDRIVFLARLPIIGLGLMLAALVFRWASARFGPWGGLLAAAFCALDPNVLAHERLSTTDVGATFFVFLAAYAFWRMLRRPSASRILWAGLALGLAFAAKLSALLFGPILALAILLDAIPGGPGRIRRLLSRAGIVMMATLLALLVVWAAYRFQVGPLEEGGIPVPAPPYIRGIQAILDFASGGRPGYLLGQLNTEGWWYYFPVAFAVKTPLATLAGLLIATLAMLRRPTRDDLFILFPPLLFFLISITARLNLGYRHLLPMLPFLAVHLARLVRLRVSPYLPVALVLWLALATARIYPHFLAYFNPVGGGPENGWRILADSNVDWGQDLKGLRAWMKREGVEQVRLSWFGSAYPEAYDIIYDPLPGVGFGSYFELWSNPPFTRDDPEPGIYVISANNLVGLALPDPDLYAWFRARPPDDHVGYSLLIYRVTDQ
jgi:4-amino-4-deoxy-L-arabinose transferase-like glycosyltransferase